MVKLGNEVYSLGDVLDAQATGGDRDAGVLPRGAEALIDGDGLGALAFASVGDDSAADGLAGLLAPADADVDVGGVAGGGHEHRRRRERTAA